MPIRFLFFCLFSVGIRFLIIAQPTIDTIVTPAGKLVINEDRTWSIATDPKFSGVLNPRIHQIVSSMNPPLKQGWNNESCFTGKGNEVANLKDTIWLCLNENIDNVSVNDFTMPLKKITVTSHYGPRSGRYHNGIDLALHVGDTVYAAFSGKVRYAKYNDGGFGNLVIVRHYNGLETFHAHLSKFLVAPNQEVKSGDPIALGGNTGRSSGPHLHYEVRFYDANINPEEIIDFSKSALRKENLFVHKGLFRPGAKPTDFVEVLPADQIAENLKNNPSDVELVAAPIPKPVVMEAEKKYYRIKAGDTLTQIAAKYHTTVSKICKLNGISHDTTLKIGRSLRVK